MNLVDCYVTEVKDEPYEAYGKWWLPVLADSYGHVSETTIMCETEEEADAIAQGHHFLA